MSTLAYVLVAIGVVEIAMLIFIIEVVIELFK